MEISRPLREWHDKRGWRDKKDGIIGEAEARGNFLQGDPVLFLASFWTLCF